MSKSWFEGMGHTRTLYRRYQSKFPQGCPWWAVFAAHGSLYGFGSPFCKDHGSLRLYFDIPWEPDVKFWWDCYKQKWFGTRNGLTLESWELHYVASDIEMALNDWLCCYTVVYPKGRHDAAYFATSLEEALDHLLGISGRLSSSLLAKRPVEIYKPESDCPMMIFESLADIPGAHNQE